jgi:hypothetical protein
MGRCPYAGPAQDSFIGDWRVGVVVAGRNVVGRRRHRQEALDSLSTSAA